MINNTGKIKKGWGYEKILFSNDWFAVKLMVFTRAKNKFSMHLHKNKTESWLVHCGSFYLYYIDPTTAKKKRKTLNKGDYFNVAPMLMHQLVAKSTNATILEVSTADHKEDNYRYGPGNSQK